ncbi:ferredoxin-type protein NapF [Marinobacter sp. chi1]|uniref:Ferredoxin-type protein NapF n=1 Tax=Marinobacter suaedae TaxID=3057675 RepID=A0ABT8W1Z7_9GAMM|nr:ferredoxin-type protein NapF [Marinobacter sp. chi1]MDO3722250.1 ferredoxin-type protein NapF [Marinobacter sp. chi1]
MDRSRRNLLLGKPLQVAPPLRLPWLVSEAVFAEGCTQCGDCLSACPEDILVRGEDGSIRVDFSGGECTFCHRCVDACAEPLFRAADEPAWLAALHIKDNCLAKNSIYCQSCKDVCDAQAIEFRYDSAIPTPRIRQSLCTQCGACVGTCPSQSLELIPLLEPDYAQ